MSCKFHELFTAAEKLTELRGGRVGKIHTAEAAAEVAAAGPAAAPKLAISRACYIDTP